MYHRKVLEPFTSVGQSWLGLAIAAAYAYFGLKPESVAKTNRVIILHEAPLTEVEAEHPINPQDRLAEAVLALQIRILDPVGDRQ